VGGGVRSRHKVGDAFDISLRTVKDKTRLISSARRAGFTGLGYYQTFLHVDTGRARWWFGKGGQKIWNGLI
jgi:uncharacterized protein YcbK (DUF882 family)